MSASVSSGLPVSSGLEKPRRQAAASSVGSSDSSRISRLRRSSALLRAAIASQAAGRCGVPSNRHCASAAPKASCPSSSISSSGPGRSSRTNHAQILPASWRNRSSRAGAASVIGRSKLFDLAHLDVAAVLQVRALGGQAAGLGIIAGRDEEIAADDLLALDERAVGRGDAAALVAEDSARFITQLAAGYAAASWARALSPFHVLARYPDSSLRIGNRAWLGGPMQQQHETRHGRTPYGLRRLPPLRHSVDRGWSEPTWSASSSAATHICGAQELHQPAAFTSLPGKSWQGPWVEPLGP